MPATAATEAASLEGRQLVDPGGDDDHRGDVRIELVPEQAVRSEAEGGPHGEVPNREEDSGEDVEDSREPSGRDRARQHHRRGHRDPDAEVPLQIAQTHARATVHSAHPFSGDDPRRDRRSNEEERRPAASGERAHAPIKTARSAKSHRRRGLRRYAAATLTRVDARWRRATTMPARQPGARPPDGTRIASGSKPLRAMSHEISEFEFHI